MTGAGFFAARLLFRATLLGAIPEAALLPFAAAAETGLVMALAAGFLVPGFWLALLMTPFPEPVPEALVLATGDWLRLLLVTVFFVCGIIKLRLSITLNFVADENSA